MSAEGFHKHFWGCLLPHTDKNLGLIFKEEATLAG